MNNNIDYKKWYYQLLEEHQELRNKHELLKLNYVELKSKYEVEKAMNKDVNK